jgi:hypothetical protein
VPLDEFPRQVGDIANYRVAVNPTFPAGEKVNLRDRENLGTICAILRTRLFQKVCGSCGESVETHY